MPNTVKGNAGRKPPEPSAKHADIDAWVKTLVPRLQPIVSAIDKSIRRLGVEADEQWGQRGRRVWMLGALDCSDRLSCTMTL